MRERQTQRIKMGKDVSFYTAFTLSESSLLVAEERCVSMNTASPILSFLLVLYLETFAIAVDCYRILVT